MITGKSPNFFPSKIWKLYLHDIRTATCVVVSLWKYFKCPPPESVKKCKDEGQPTGPLSKSMPVKAIEFANAQVKKVQLDKTHDSGRESRGEHSYFWIMGIPDLPHTSGLSSTSVSAFTSGSSLALLGVHELVWGYSDFRWDVNKTASRLDSCRSNTVQLIRHNGCTSW